MNNEQKLREIFAEALDIELAQVTDELTYNSIPEWDSCAYRMKIYVATPSRLLRILK